MAGQVLYGSRRTYLRKVAVAEFDGICANTTFVLEPSGEDLLPELLPFIMQTESFVAHSVKQSKGSVNPYINFSDLAWYTFALPPLDEQRRIAEILWAADAQVCRYEECIPALMTYKAVLFDQLLAKASIEWPAVRFDAVMRESPRSGYSAVPADRDTGHYVLALSALTPSGYAFGQLKPVNPTPEVLATRLRKGDFLISRSNTIDLVGFVAIYPEDRDDVSYPDTMMLISLDDRQMDVRFLEQFLLSRAGRRQIQAIAAGTSASMKKINRKGLASILLPLPSLPVQPEIVRQLDAVARRITSTKEHLDQCKRLRQRLIENLLSGEKRDGALHV